MTTLLPPDISLKALLKLAGPIFVANVAIIGSGTIDTIMGGQLGKEHLAAIALGISATISVLMGLVGILQGLSPIAGHHFGARRPREIGIDVAQAFWLVIFLSMIGVPLLAATDFWTDLGGVTGEVKRMAADYLFWTAMALPGSMAARVFIAVNAAVSRPKITMWVSLGMLVLKVPLNAIFMYGLLGFPAMGGGGAGVSFFVLTYVSLFAYWIIWRKSAYFLPMHSNGFVRPQYQRLKELLKVGVPMGICTFFEVSSFTLMAIFVSRLGPAVISAHQPDRCESDVTLLHGAALGRHCLERADCAEFGRWLASSRRNRHEAYAAPHPFYCCPRLARALSLSRSDYLALYQRAACS